MSEMGTAEQPVDEAAAEKPKSRRRSAKPREAAPVARAMRTYRILAVVSEDDPDVWRVVAAQDARTAREAIQEYVKTLQASGEEVAALYQAVPARMWGEPLAVHVRTRVDVVLGNGSMNG